MHGPCDAPDACLHGGVCSLTADSAVHCDCSLTDYTGNRCQFGEFYKDKYEILEFNTGKYELWGDIDLERFLLGKILFGECPNWKYALT